MIQLHISQVAPAQDGYFLFQLIRIDQWCQLVGQHHAQRHIVDAGWLVTPQQWKYTIVWYMW